ncbi:MAG: HupE/UreJ family protein [Parahaliea sp.]
MWLPSILTLIASVIPTEAFAHSPIEGVGYFYGGLLHPLMVLPHALLLLMLSLLVGQRGIQAMRYAYPAFLLSLLSGLLATAFKLTIIPAQSLLLILAACFGLLVALKVTLAVHLTGLLAALAGLLIGMDSSVGELGRQQTFAAILGCWVGAAVILIIISGLVEIARQPWLSVGIRILGSWGLAMTMLVLALSFR